MHPMFKELFIETDAPWPSGPPSVISSRGRDLRPPAVPPPISALNPGMLRLPLIVGDPVRPMPCSRCHQWPAVRGGWWKAGSPATLPAKDLAFWLTARY
jgi:hypothetical protein